MEQVITIVKLTALIMEDLSSMLKLLVVDESYEESNSYVESIKSRMEELDAEFSTLMHFHNRGKI
jgi:hypothetical protein